MAGVGQIGWVALCEVSKSMTSCEWDEKPQEGEGMVVT